MGRNARNQWLFRNDWNHWGFGHNGWWRWSGGSRSCGLSGSGGQKIRSWSRNINRATIFVQSHTDCQRTIELMRIVPSFLELGKGFGMNQWSKNFR